MDARMIVRIGSGERARWQMLCGMKDWECGNNDVVGIVEFKLKFVEFRVGNEDEQLSGMKKQ